MSENKTIIYDYLKQNKLMALATANKSSKPEVATVEYVLDGDDLLLNTFVYYRKYTNLTNNPQVACVVTTGEDKTLQFDADVIALDGSEADSVRQKMLEEEPNFADFFNDTDTRFFRLRPTWMRLRDYTNGPVKEIEFRP